MQVIKATGEKEEFSEQKLRASIHRAGIPDAIQNQVVQHVKEKLHDGIKTSEVYNHVREFLGATEPFAKSKYSLKQAIMELGPTGYPFEDYIARVFEALGYTTAVRSIVRGACITHEVDVIAEKTGEKLMIEAKYHNLPGNKTNVHVSLYTKARFDDVKDNNHFTTPYLVTNTNITSDALIYAQCNNMKVISWSYPEGEALRDLVSRFQLIPITAILSLSQNHKQQLLSSGIVLAKDLLSKQQSLSALNLSKEKTDEVLKEAHYISSKG